MRRFTLLILMMLLNGCGVLQDSPRPAPPVADHPQEIRRSQTKDLQRMGIISVLVWGSPMDAEKAIRDKAIDARADYYIIIMIDETFAPGQWYSQAILYRK